MGKHPPPPPAPSAANHSPSHARRERLKQTECQTIPTLSNLFPIERYYDAAYKVLEAHDAAMEAHHLDDAYVYGKRFGNFASKALPTHDYYRSPQPKYRRLRLKCETDLGRVIDQLEKVAALMDVEERERQKREEEERKRAWEAEQARRKEEEARRKAAEAERRKREAILAHAEARRKAEEAGEEYDETAAAATSVGSAPAVVGLTDKLDLLNELFPQTPSGVGADQKNSQLPPAEAMSQLFVQEPPPPPPYPQPSASASDIPIGSDLPLPLPVPPPGSNEVENGHAAPGPSAPLPPSYTEAMGKPGNGMAPPPPSYASVAPQGSIAAPAGGMHPPPTTRTDSNGGVIVAPHAPTEWNKRQARVEPTAPKDEVIPYRKLRQRLAAQYQDLRKRNMVETFFLNTYQGRNKVPGRDSTNGCAVISPLVAARHLRNTASSILPDRVIEHVIDEEAPPILSAVRSKLGLGHGALIIPSDVHDYLVDRKMLKQDTFVGVCGGNILDSKHIGALVDMLHKGDEKKDHESTKLAATLFFREHVISILKVVNTNGTAWFDIVDSLPHRDSDALRASRTRCKGRDALEISLKWYACSKFSETDRNYIDSNLWDEVMCDFDPRVYQGFVWAAE